MISTNIENNIHTKSSPVIHQKAYIFTFIEQSVRTYYTLMITKLERNERDDDWCITIQKGPVHSNRITLNLYQFLRMNMKYRSLSWSSSRIKDFKLTINKKFKFRFDEIDSPAPIVCRIDEVMIENHMNHIVLIEDEKGYTTEQLYFPEKILNLLALYEQSLIDFTHGVIRDPHIFFVFADEIHK